MVFKCVKNEFEGEKEEAVEKALIRIYFGTSVEQFGENFIEERAKKVVA